MAKSVRVKFSGFESLTLSASSGQPQKCGSPCQQSSVVGQKCVSLIFYLWISYPQPCKDVVFPQPGTPINIYLSQLLHCARVFGSNCNSSFLVLVDFPSLSLGIFKSRLPFPQPKGPKNGSQTSLIIVQTHQKYCKCQWLKV